MLRRKRPNSGSPLFSRGNRQHLLTDIGLFGAMAAATTLLVVGILDVELDGNIPLALVVFALCCLLAWLDGRIRTRMWRLIVLLGVAILCSAAYVWLR